MQALGAGLGRPRAARPNETAPLLTRGSPPPSAATVHRAAEAALAAEKGGDNRLARPAHDLLNACLSGAWERFR